MMILTRTIQTTRKTGRGRRGRRSFFFFFFFFCFDDENVENEIISTTTKRKRKRKKHFSNARTRTTNFAIFRLRSEFPVSTMDIRVLGMLAGALFANRECGVSSRRAERLIGALLVCACFCAPELGRRIQKRRLDRPLRQRRTRWICSVGPRSF